MSTRTAPLALLLALPLALACVGKRGPAERESPDASPNQSSTKGKRGAGGSRNLGEAKAAGAETIEVPVVALDPGAVSPCERMCGRVGDCLISHERSEVAAASRLELACLDTCVNADPEQRAAADFQACEGKNECGAVLGCARATWDAAAASRVNEPIGIEFAESMDVCEVGCLAATSCAFYYKMPADSEDLQDSYFDQNYAQCLITCEQYEAWYSAWAECSKSIDCDQAHACTASVIQARGIW